MGQSTINGPFSIAFCMFTRGYYSKYIHQLTINSPRKSFPSPGLEVRLPLLQGQHLLAWCRAILATAKKNMAGDKKKGKLMKIQLKPFYRLCFLFLVPSSQIVVDSNAPTNRVLRGNIYETSCDPFQLGVGGMAAWKRTRSERICWLHKSSAWVDGGLALLKRLGVTSLYRVCEPV